MNTTESLSENQFKSMTLAERKELSTQMNKISSSRVPVILMRSARSKLPLMANVRIGIPKNYKGRHLQAMLRPKLNIPEDSSLILFCGMTIIKPEANIDELYERFKNEDGFLHLNYQEMESFGA